MTNDSDRSAWSVRAVFALEAYMFSAGLMAVRDMGYPWIVFLGVAPAVAAIFGIVAPDRLLAVRVLEVGLHFLAALIGAELIALLATLIIE